MQKKLKLNTVLLIIIIILLAIGLFYIISNNSKQEENNLVNNLPTESQNKIDNFDWNSFPKEDFINIISENKDLYFVPEYGLSLTQTIDITGDGQEEAIVSGNGGNNDVSFILIKEIDGSISIAKWKDMDGNITPVSLMELSRVMFSERFTFLPKEHGFYITSLVLDQSVNNQISSNFKCNTNGVKGYVWNSNTKLFEWNKSLTTLYTAQTCK